MRRCCHLIPHRFKVTSNLPAKRLGASLLPDVNKKVPPKEDAMYSLQLLWDVSVNNVCQHTGQSSRKITWKVLACSEKMSLEVPYSKVTHLIPLTLVKMTKKFAA